MLDFKCLGNRENIKEYDVIVCGGGPAGVSAAISAARVGAKTLVVERNSCLGGIWTAGLLTWILDLIFQLPVLKTANTFFGLIFGILAAILLAWVLSAMSVTLVRAMASVAPEYFSESVIENSVVLRFFSNNQFQTIVAYLTR